MHRVYRALLGENPFLFLSFALIAWCTSRRLLSMAPRQRISSNLLLSARTIVLFLFLGAVWVCWKVFVMLSFKRWSMIDYYIMQFFSTVCALVLLRACCFGCLGAAFFSQRKEKGGLTFQYKASPLIPNMLSDYPGSMPVRCLGSVCAARSSWTCRSH